MHRDVKPANITLTKAGAKLLDFGLAKLRAPGGPIALSRIVELATTPPGTAQGTILGTVQYMAPEQVEGKDADARSDIWALGAVIYEMVTGTRPFMGDTPASVKGRVRRTEILLRDLVLPPPEVGGQQQSRDEELTSRITVVFGPDAHVGTWVPIEMRERYDNSWGEVTTGRATYTNYRKFRTTARVVGPGS